MKNMTEAKISAKNNADKNFTSRFHIQLEWRMRKDHAELLGFLFLEMNFHYVLVSDNFVILFYKTMVITYHRIIILW